jgi:DNA-binding NtrC family response regulator
MADERRILVAEDDPATRRAWSELIDSWGYRVEAAADGEQALNLIESFSPHILLLDLRLPRKDGFAVLEAIREQGLDLPSRTIVISGHGDIPDAVRAMKLGVYDYMRKPVDPAHLRIVMTNLAQHVNVSQENLRLRQLLRKAGQFGKLVGGSSAMQRVMALVEQLAPSTASAILRGESGTGKELVARTIHDLSPRCDGPYVAINCAAMPETLMESELFGHERGAFTGADRRREGCFELANGGTLLLDEITEMKTELQAKLLRVIEEQKLRRLGSSAEIALDVRVLAASNRNIEEALRDAALREDLYYRLNVFTIELPPLRDRPEDIPDLINYFIGELSGAQDQAAKSVDNEALEVLRNYRWPGNVRQLRNVIQRALIVSRGPLIVADDLPPEVRRMSGNAAAPYELPLGSSLDDLEREFIRRTLEFTSGNKGRAAELLGISLKTLYNRLERYQAKNW